MLSTALVLIEVSIVLFLCNLNYWIDPQSKAGKISAGLWWFTSILFLLEFNIKPGWLLFIPFILTWGVDLLVKKYKIPVISKLKKEV